VRGACIEPSHTPGIPEVCGLKRTHCKIKMRAAGDTRVSRINAKNATTGTTITTTIITTGSSPRQQQKLTCITSYDHYMPLDERDAASFITPDRTRKSSSSGTTVTSPHTYARRKSGKLDERTMHREKANRILYRSFLPPFLPSSSFPSFHLIFLCCFLISGDIGFFQ